MKLLALLNLLFIFSVIGANIETVQDGQWASNSTWSDTYPGCYDTIIINHDIEILKQRNLESCGPIVLIINGSLGFKQGNKLKLPLGSEIIINSGGSVFPLGGGGSSSLISIAGNDVWDASDGTIDGPGYTDGTTHLPVEYIGSKYDCIKHELSWKTLSELNNNYFSIKIGTTFNDGILIPTQTIIIYGNGTTNYPSKYLIDFIIENKYVEIWQTDYDGTSERLEVFHIACFGQEKVRIVTNPGTETNGVVIHGEIKSVQIYDLLGKEVFAIIIDNKIIGLSSGMYIVIINNRYTFKIIIKK